MDKIKERVQRGSEQCGVVIRVQVCRSGHFIHLKVEMIIFVRAVLNLCHVMNRMFQYLVYNKSLVNADDEHTYIRTSNCNNTFIIGRSTLI